MSDVVKCVNSPHSQFLNENCLGVYGFKLIKKGLLSFDKIPKMKWLYLQGVFFTFILFILYFILYHYLLYQALIAPVIEYYVDKINQMASWLTYLTTPTGWLFKVLSWLVLFLMAQKSATITMGFWLDKLITLVIAHFREVEDVPFKLSNIIKGILFSLKNLPFWLLLMLLGFIPIVGTIIAFTGAACSLGFDIMSPYILVLAEQDKEMLKTIKIRKKQSLITGIVQGGFGFIPILGWLIQPFLMVLQIIGFAYYCEERWKVDSQKDAK